MGHMGQHAPVINFQPCYATKKYHYMTTITLWYKKILVIAFLYPIIQ